MTAPLSQQHLRPRPCRLCILLAGLLLCLAGRVPAVSGQEEPAGENPFAKSQLISSAKKICEGESIAYSLIVRASSLESPQRITVVFRMPGPAMLVAAPQSMALSEEYNRELTWEGEIAPQQELSFPITLVTLPDSASNGLLLADVGIYWRPKGREWEAESHWLQSETEIRARLTPILYVLPGGYGIGKVELVLLGYLVLGPLLMRLIPWLILRRENQLKAGRPKVTAEEEKLGKKFLYALSFAFVFLIGMAHLLGSIVLEDIRRFAAYQQTTCTVLDKRIDLETGTSSGRGGTTTTYHKPLVAVRYPAADREIVAVGMPKPNSPISAAERFALRQLARYERGKSYPCWYDPGHPETFVLARGLSWLWYLLGAGPLLLLYFLGRYLRRRLRG